MTKIKNGYSLKKFAKRNGIGITAIYSEINSGGLIARKCGTRTIGTPADEQTFQIGEYFTSFHKANKPTLKSGAVSYFMPQTKRNRSRA